MKANATLKFWIGCIAIIIFAVLHIFFDALQWFFPGFLLSLFIIFMVIICIRQWQHKIGEMKNSLEKAQNGLLAADKFILERMSPSSPKRKKR